MSTVIVFLELATASLIGILLYKLYKTYFAWQKSELAVQSDERSSSDSSDSDVITVSKVYINLTRKSDSTPKESLQSFAASDSKSVFLDRQLDAANKADDLPQKSVASDDSKKTEKASKPASILTSYIDEFFTVEESSSAVNLDAFRAKPFSEQIPEKLEPRTEHNVLSVAVDSDQEKTAQTLSNEKHIPTLKELSDMDPAAFITVNHEDSIKPSQHNVMSDKVVLAMLDEAKLICAS